MQLSLRAVFVAAVLVAAEAANYRRFVDYIISGVDVEGFCEQCESVLQLLKADPQGTLESALNACKRSQYFTERICDAEHRIYAGTVVQIIEQLKISLDEACKFLSNGACGSPGIEVYNWTLQLDSIPDDDTFDPDYFRQTEAEWKNTHLSMLHVSDTHFDEDYEVGASADCGEPACCSKYQNQTNDPKDFAGPWGYSLGKSCNVPFRTVENMFQDIDRSRHVSFGIWTGDASPHSLINMTEERARRDIQETTAVIKRYLGQTKIYTAFGNHDAYPARMFPSPEVDAGDFSVKPIYEELWNLWYDWLPADQEETFKYGGYYTAKPHDRLRIISLNTNFCYTANWWLVLSANDPARQLQWLAATLQKARRNRERVFIIGHIPPGSSSCNENWQKAYFKIVTKFRKTVTGQFFAHTHSDKVILDYSDPTDRNKATSVLYITPAATTSWSGMPEYRIFQTEMGAVVDIETYFLNLTTANAGYFKIRESVHDKVREDVKLMSPFRRRAMEKVLYGVPSWELGYSARKSYGLKKFDAEHWQRLVESFDTDDSLLQTFYKHYTQFREDVVTLDRPCNASCKESLVSEMSTGRTQHASEPELGPQE